MRLLQQPSLSKSFQYGRSVYLYDSNGSKWLDAASGTFNLSLGYSHPSVVSTIQRQATALIHLSTTYQNDLADTLATKLSPYLPRQLNRFHFKATGGSTANEIALKLAKSKRPQSTRIVSFEAGHHGQSSLLASLSGLSWRRKHEIGHFDPVILPTPPEDGLQDEIATANYLNLLDGMLKDADPESIIAIIFEPILGNGHNISVPKCAAKFLSDFGARNNIPIIVDEVQTGFGRTGDFFGFLSLGIIPDIVTIAKGMTGCGLPLGGIITTSEFEAIGTEHMSFTGGANLLALASAIATIEVIEAESILDNVRSRGEFLINEIRRLVETYSFVTGVRGRGLMIGIEVQSGDIARLTHSSLASAICAAAFDNQLIVRSSQYGRGSTLKIRPPLVINDEQCIELVDKLRLTLDGVNF